MARKSSADSGGFLFKTGVFALLAGVAFWLFNMFGANKDAKPMDTAPPIEVSEIPASSSSETTAEMTCQVPDEILPVSTTDDIVRHTWYVLSYDEDHEQAEWVAYELSRERLNANWASRPNTFRPDPDVRTESATPRDYMSSGYDKGHLCPAADMAFSASAIDESFFMSNISPQEPAFNGGIWRELEELTRDWARKFNRLYVVTGPILTQSDYKQIGFSKVSVPNAFYKVLLAPEQRKAIAFVLPNTLGDSPIMEYAMTIDKVEKLSGIDFFPKLLKGLDEALEASLDTDAWPVNKSREEERIKVWNVRRK